MGVGRAELWGVSKQLKIPPRGGFGTGCKICYIFLEGGGGVRATWRSSGYILGYASSSNHFKCLVYVSGHFLNM